MGAAIRVVPSVSALLFNMPHSFKFGFNEISDRPRLELSVFSEQCNIRTRRTARVILIRAITIVMPGHKSRLMLSEPGRPEDAVLLHLLILISRKSTPLRWPRPQFGSGLV